MTMYCSLAEARATIGLEPTDTADDAYISQCILAASGRIESHCGRTFTLDSVVSARLYEPSPLGSSYIVDTDDIATTAGLIVKSGSDGTFPTTLASYELAPLNGIGPNGRGGWPYRQIRLVAGNFYTPVVNSRYYTVQVTAQWGWLAVPDEVTMACRLIAHQVFRSKDAPFGAAGVNEGIISLRDNPIIGSLLAPYRLVDAFIGIA